MNIYYECDETPIIQILTLAVFSKSICDGN